MRDPCARYCAGRKMMRCGSLCAVLWCALSWLGLLPGSSLPGIGGAVAAADTMIAQTNQPSPVSAYGDVVAWSTFSAGAYRLVVDVDGTIAPVSTAPEPQAFEASVGPNRDNEAVVLFSRCRRYGSDPSQLLFGGVSSSGCRIYTYSVSRRTVLPLALGGGASASFTHASQWRSQVAVVQSTRTGGSSIEVISLPSRRRTKLSRGTFDAASVDSLQLAGSRLSAGWYAGKGLETEVMLDTLSGSGEVLQESTRRLHAQAQNSEAEPALFGAGVAGREAYWVAAGDQLIGTPSVLTFYNYYTHTSSSEEAPPDVFSAALSSGRLYYSTGTVGGGCPCEIFTK